MAEPVLVSRLSAPYITTHVHLNLKLVREANACIQHVQTVGDKLLERLQLENLAQERLHVWRPRLNECIGVERDRLSRFKTQCITVATCNTRYDENTVRVWHPISTTSSIHENRFRCDWAHCVIVVGCPVHSCRFALTSRWHIQFLVCFLSGYYAFQHIHFVLELVLVISHRVFIRNYRLNAVYACVNAYPYFL